MDNLNGPITVYPSYSTYLFIGETLGHNRNLRIANIFPGRQANGSTITTAGGDTSAGQRVAYGFWDDSNPKTVAHPVKLALLNLEIYNRTQTIPRPETTFDISDYVPRSAKSFKVLRLQAPGADVKEPNATFWAGQTFTHGLAEGERKVEVVKGSKITVAASEAALVFVS